MALSINWSTRVITVPQADLAVVSVGRYALDIEVFRLALKDIEDGETGVAFPDTHRRNAPVLLSGVTYSQTFEIINGYTVTFQDTGTPYTVQIVGANHNIADVKNVNNVSLIVGNSAGLITVATGGGGGEAGPTAAQISAAVLATLSATRLPVDAQLINGVDPTAAMGNAVWQHIIESGMTSEQMLRVLMAVIAGNATSLNGPNPVFKSIDGTKTRLTGAVDGTSRTINTRDGT